MNKPSLSYEIRILGLVAPGWADWFPGIPSVTEGHLTTLMLDGVDRSTLYGVLKVLGDLDRTLVSVILQETSV